MADALFHPDAQAEYEAAIAWYAARSPRAAARFEAEVERVLSLIAGNADMFPAYDDANRYAVLRRFPFSIVYQIHSGQLYVVAVAHAGRSPGYWQGRA